MDETKQNTEEVASQVPSENSYTPAMISVVIGALIIIAALVGWYLYSVKNTKSEIETSTQSGIGSELFADVDNPVEGELPGIETSSNPLEEIYKNPFE